MSYIQDPYELELVERCLKDERSAQRSLYEKYKNAMYTILLRMLSDQDDADDALQEAFIEVFRSLKNYEKRSSLGAWIKVIVVRVGLRKQRKSQIFFDPMDNVSDNQSVIVWDENLTGEYLEKGIRQLPEGYRNIFLLIEVEGYSHKEVAALLNISEGTSKSQLHHSKKMLQKTLQQLMH